MSEARAYEPTVTRVKTVTMIPPRLQAMPGMPTFAVRPKRVAAYARVSTNSEEQLTSYEAQVKHPPANAGDVRDLSLIPGSGRCPGGGNGNSLQYSCLENAMHRGA